MFFDSSSVGGQVTITAASAARFSELVRKTETSTTASSRKRKNAARKKLKRVIKEQIRYAKVANLRAVALTLTYRNAAEFSPKHISAFLARLRRTLKRAGYKLPYAWVLERASRLHYHLLVWLPRGYTLDAAKLTRSWPWGSTWFESCRSVRAWGLYMAKFDSTEKLPLGARLYGYGGLDEAGKLAVARVALPGWLCALLPDRHGGRRCPGGGWVNVVTGEIYRCPYAWTPWGTVLRSDDISRL